METQTTKISSKGQLVIPRKIREQLHINEGTLFAITGDKETIIIKKIKAPSKEELIKDLERIAKQGRKRAEKLGIKEKDVPELIRKTRKRK